MHAPNFVTSSQGFHFKFVKSVIDLRKIRKYLTFKQGS